MAKIVQLTAREILDSRGNPTVEAKVVLDNDLVAKASVPSGASTGVHEAHELRDDDQKRYSGKGVLQAVTNIKEIIAPKIIGQEIIALPEIDQIMIDLDGRFEYRVVTNSGDEGFDSSLKAFLEEQKNVAYPKPTKDKDIRINVDFKSEG